MNELPEKYSPFELAFDLIQYTNHHVFLTGSAGTGKTFFLQQTAKQLIKNFVILAPTGVAAIAAGGQTIHSFFKLPTGVLLTPDLVRNSILDEITFNKAKIELINELDTIIIDEVSMLRADVLDAMNFLLKKFRKKTEPFGGIQMVFIGDLFQLPPVVSEQEKETFYYFYELPYLFKSRIFQQISYVAIELENVFRQQHDPEFVDILEHIRKGLVREEHLKKINARVDPYFDWFFNKNYIVLTTLNKTVDEINHSRLAQLKGKEWLFEAEIEGNFPENIYPAPYQLRLKAGARIMFLKNDLSPQKRYYNGKIGTIIDMEEDVLTIEVDDLDEHIELEKHTWENIQYYLDFETKEIKRDVVGTFTQFPVKLAWAFTVHKSQGLTFSNIYCDLQRIFSHGQVYVALSRCTNLQGIVLKSPIYSSSIRIEKEVSKFYEQLSNKTVEQVDISYAKQMYWTWLITNFFNEKDIENQLLDIISLLPQPQPELLTWFKFIHNFFFDPWQKNNTSQQLELLLPKNLLVLLKNSQHPQFLLFKFIPLLSESFLWLAYFHNCHHPELMNERTKWKAFQQTLLKIYRKLHVSSKMLKAKTMEEQMLLILKRTHKDIPLLFMHEPLLFFDNILYLKLRWWRNFHLHEMIDQPILFVNDETLWALAQEPKIIETHPDKYFSTLQWSLWGEELLQVLKSY